MPVGWMGKLGLKGHVEDRAGVRTQACRCRAAAGLFIVYTTTAPKEGPPRGHGWAMPHARTKDRGLSSPGPLSGVVQGHLQRDWSL